MLRMDRRIVRSVFLYLLFISVFSVSVKAQEKFRIMFYNVENMYDTKDNPDKNDDDLTPTGQLRWTNYKYWKKLNNISKVISAVGNGYPPAIVGLSEVENDSVLFDFTKKTSLRKHKYEYIGTYSKDIRSSNVALLYQRDQIKIISKKTYTPVIDSVRTTRDILHVTGKVVNGKILDIFVCHFPSRSEGIKRTRPFRIACAKLLKQKTDSLLRIRKGVNIIIMGDFNDYPNDISLSETLQAKPIVENVSENELYNMFYNKMADKSIGSYKYRGKWNYIDQFIVSGHLLNPANKVSIREKDAYVFIEEYLLTPDNKKYGGTKPLRTYSGFKYLGGYSDHLPIYMDLVIK